MKRLFMMMAGAITLIVSAGITEAKEDKITLIEMQKAFETAVVGKLLIFNKNKVTSFTVFKDGKWKGTWKGKGMGGTWKFVDGAWCRVLVGKGEDCQIWEIDETGKKFQVTRARGEGKNSPLRLSNKI